MMHGLSIQSALRQVDSAALMGSDLAGGPGRVPQRWPRSPVGVCVFVGEGRCSEAVECDLSFLLKSKS